MLSHICIGVKDFERAFGFYTKLMEAMGNTLRFCDRNDRGLAGNRIQTPVHYFSSVRRMTGMRILQATGKWSLSR